MRERAKRREKDGKKRERREVADSERGHRRERNRERRKEIEVSTAVSVLLPYQEGSAHSLNMS